MSRPLILALRSSRRVIRPIHSHWRGYAVDSQQQDIRDMLNGAKHSGSSSKQAVSIRWFSNGLNSKGRRLPGAVDRIDNNSVKLTFPLPNEYTISAKTIDKDYVQLRDACICPRCVDPHSKQRTFRTSDIPEDIEARTIQWVDENLVITWKNDIPGYDDSHVSTYDSEYLQYPRLYAPGSNGRSRQRIYWDKQAMQQIQHWIAYDDYINNNAEFTRAMRFLAEYGLIFVKDIPDSRDMVERVATRMGPLRNSFYGATWDVKTVPKAKNVAYTNQNLGFHMDLMYMHDPPCYQLLHCLKNSCKGGDSLFVDTFNVALNLSGRDFKQLLDYKLSYHYNHEDQFYHNTWPLIELNEVESSDDSSRKIKHINYSPPFQAPCQSTRGPNGWSDRTHQFEALRAFTQGLEKEDNIFELKLNPGECVIFENRRIAHARRAFDTAVGERWLAGAYVDGDAVLSRFRVLQRDKQEVWREPDSQAGLDKAAKRSRDLENSR